LIEYLKLVKDDNQAIKVPLQDGTSINILPSENLTIPLNVDEIKKAGFVPKDVEPLLTNQMNWSIGTSGILKPQLVQLDIIAQNAANGWKRPIYFASSLSKVSYLNMKEFMQLEGYAYRLMPVKIEGATEGIVNTAVLERNLMKKMVWKILTTLKCIIILSFISYQPPWEDYPFNVWRASLLMKANTKKQKIP
jgi:hypothetical protein